MLSDKMFKEVINQSTFYFVINEFLKNYEWFLLIDLKLDLNHPHWYLYTKYFFMCNLYVDLMTKN